MPHRSLVVVRAGDRSLHPGWLAGPEPPQFDLIVSYFGDDPDRCRTPAEQRVDRKGTFWDGIHALFQDRPELLGRYDHFLLPDDDIEADAASINEVFRTAREHDLHLCQPSLSLDSYFSWLETLNQPAFTLRYTTLVEVMVPCLSRALLERCLPLFPLAGSGFGVDQVWAHLLGPTERSTAIIDRVQVRHTRPVGLVLAAALRRAGHDSGRERDDVLGAFGLNRPPRAVCHSAIARDGSFVSSPPAVNRAMRRHLLRNARDLRCRRRYLLRGLARMQVGAIRYRPIQPLRERA